MKALEKYAAKQHLTERLTKVAREFGIEKMLLDGLVGKSPSLAGYTALGAGSGGLAGGANALRKAHNAAGKPGLGAMWDTLKADPAAALKSGLGSAAKGAGQGAAVGGATGLAMGAGFKAHHLAKRRAMQQKLRIGAGATAGLAGLGALLGSNRR